MCGAKAGGPDASTIKPGETTIQGSVTRDGEPVTGYVRLLDSTGEFTAEVPTSATGQFRFYAAEGSSVGGWNNAVWNMTFSGVEGAPAQSFPEPPY
ncbi:DUF1416 domain-containing protein, partial [Streptomyces sp. NPDC088184]|uniref:DUF1416 domain-containing protein n=1 Tax=Streptomyces sp. NPDC088184 TaxID=3160991 RepID=UPI003429264F